MRLKVFVSVFLLLLSVAWARVEFERVPFSADKFSGFDDLQKTCAAPAAASFWCGRLNEPLTLITTKGLDYVFDDAGELLALFPKQQNGQNFVTKEGTHRSSLTGGRNGNLIPADAAVPAGAILLDGDYTRPEDATETWTKVETDDGPYLKGEFSYTLGGVRIDKTLIVRNTNHTTDITVKATRIDGAEAATLIQYVLPGIGQGEAQVVKVGQGDSFTLDPVPQPVDNPSYISLQNNNRNTCNALFLVPGDVTDTTLSAQTLSGGLVTMHKPLAAEAGAETTLSLQEYGGPNELVRYQQEGFLDLPGLFKPNILGQLSLGVLWVLQQIYSVVGNWGLSIIVLTLIFRVLIWPLISAQTRSMYGMQAIQPKIQALQKKYKDDREKLTQETMKIYKEEGVNPAGGCLPIIVQMPLFIILWRIFAHFEFNSGFLWLPDLGQADPYYILPLLYVGVMVAQSYFMSRGNPQQFKQQLVMNVVFVFLFLSFPAGVILYYVVSMLVQVFQYYLIQRSKPVVAAKAA
ncbi:hypothetical protein BH24DEI2_BH24DEI2_11710 [soil metagenome]